MQIIEFFMNLTYPYSFFIYFIETNDLFSNNSNDILLDELFINNKYVLNTIINDALVIDDVPFPMLNQLLLEDTSELVATPYFYYEKNEIKMITFTNNHYNFTTHPFLKMYLHIENFNLKNQDHSLKTSFKHNNIINLKETCDFDSFHKRNIMTHEAHKRYFKCTLKNYIKDVTINNQFDLEQKYEDDLNLKQNKETLEFNLLNTDLELQSLKNINIIEPGHEEKVKTLEAKKEDMVFDLLINPKHYSIENDFEKDNNNIPFQKNDIILLQKDINYYDNICKMDVKQNGSVFLEYLEFKEKEENNQFAIDNANLADVQRKITASNRYINTNIQKTQKLSDQFYMTEPTIQESLLEMYDLRTYITNPINDAKELTKEIQKLRDQSLNMAEGKELQSIRENIKYYELWCDEIVEKVERYTELSDEVNAKKPAALKESMLKLEKLRQLKQTQEIKLKEIQEKIDRNNYLSLNYKDKKMIVKQESFILIDVKDASYEKRLSSNNKPNIMDYYNKKPPQTQIQPQTQPPIPEKKKTDISKFYHKI